MLDKADAHFSSFTFKGTAVYNVWRIVSRPVCYAPLFARPCVTMKNSGGFEERKGN
jgi:hypothetical protein